MAKGNPKKLTDLRIPPILIGLSMAIIMTIAVLSTLIVQEYLKQRYFMKELDTMPSAAPTVYNSSNDIEQEVTARLKLETTDNASGDFTTLTMNNGVRKRSHKNTTMT